MAEDDVKLPPIVAQVIERVPIDELLPHPDNPNEGDVEAIIESIRAHGFNNPLLVQRSTRYVLSGNHRLEAGRQIGYDWLPVIWLDPNDAEAIGILLSDNQTAKRSVYNDERLLALLEKKAELPSGLVGTGFDRSDLDDLLDSLKADTSSDNTQAILRPTPKEQESEWTDAATRALMVPLPLLQYAAVVEGLAVLREAWSVDNNSAIVARLVAEAVRALD